MNDDAPQTPATDTCDRCGSFDAQEIGDRKLCADCVTLAGSSCAGSRDDAGG